MNKDELKVGDKIKITEDINQLNSFMSSYAGDIAIVIEVKTTNYGGQECKLDIDKGHWTWYYKDKLEQIEKL